MRSYTIRKPTEQENSGRMVPVAYMIEPSDPKHAYDSWELLPYNDTYLYARYSANYGSSSKPGAMFWHVTERNDQLHATGYTREGIAKLTVTGPR